MNKIEKEFWEKGIFRGTLIVFPKDIDIELIKACKRESVEILGIDGFLLHPDNGIQPFLEYSIDFT
jgi:hypothetical protein